LIALVTTPAASRDVAMRITCVHCGADLMLDGRVIDCRFCGVRNFISDSAAARLLGRTVPAEVVVLVGTEQPTSDAGRAAQPTAMRGLLVEGEPGLTVGT
jgi:hypothetical protein